MQISLTLHKNFPGPETTVSIGLRRHAGFIDVYFSSRKGATLVRDIGFHIPAGRDSRPVFYNVAEDDIPF